MHSPGPTIRDTEWRAMLMGSEGWSVFAGHRMISSHLSETSALLIADAPELLDALRQCNDFFASVSDSDIPERLALSVALAISRHETLHLTK